MFTGEMYKNVPEALLGMITPEILDGDNKVECEICGMKTEAKKGVKIAKFPPILTLNIMRFEFDFLTEQRKKITSPFLFDLELDVTPFLEDPLAISEPERLYELYGILIHRGDAHGGHYHAYVREVEEKLNFEKLLSESLASKSEAAPRVEPENQKEKSNRQKKKEKKREKKEEARKEEEVNMDDVPFPTESKKKELFLNWYDLNDSVVRPIPANRLATQFEGSESAYILYYRQSTLKPKPVPIPPYLVVDISKRNGQLQAIRDDYALEEKHNEIFVAAHDIFSPQEFKWVEGCDPEKILSPKKVLLTTQVSSLLTSPDNLLIETDDVTAQEGLIVLRRTFNVDSKETIEELGLLYHTVLLEVPKGHELLGLVGEKAIPFGVTLRYKQESIKVTLLETWTLSRLISKAIQHWKDLNGVEVDLFTPGAKSLIPIWKKLEKIEKAEGFSPEDLLAFPLKDFSLNKSEVFVVPRGEKDKEGIERKNKMLEVGADEDELLSENFGSLASVIVDRDDQYGATRLCNRFFP